MAETDLVGVFEIAELANVSPSAVANWRKRFSDFPAPLAELKAAREQNCGKSGPVFGESQIRALVGPSASNGFPGD